MRVQYFSYSGPIESVINAERRATYNTSVQKKTLCSGLDPTVVAKEVLMARLTRETNSIASMRAMLGW